MEWTCEKASAPEEGDGWERLYKMVPADPPREGYPDYRIGHLYQHKGEVIMCAKGFHASPCYAFCKRYVNSPETSRYLKVFLHVKEDGEDKKVGDQIYVLGEQTLSEVEAAVIVYRTPDGTVYHTRGLELHREERDSQGHTLPAVIRADGTREWWRDGKLHRDDRDTHGRTLPALIYANGTRKWYRDDKFHRDDRDEQGLTLPALIFADGTREWWRDGKLHRDDRNGQDYILPAVIRVDGTRKWYLNGKLHRDDRDAEGHLLPAVIRGEWPARVAVRGEAAPTE